MMQQDLGRMMADLAVAEKEKMDGSNSPKKPGLKIIKKRVRFGPALSNFRVSIHRVCVHLLHLYALSA